MTIMLLGLLVIAAICRFTAANPTPIKTGTYDQRQTGDLNVQIALKDLRVVALLDSELLDDYTVNESSPIGSRAKLFFFLFFYGRLFLLGRRLLLLFPFTFSLLSYFMHPLRYSLRKKIHMKILNYMC